MSERLTAEQETDIRTRHAGRVCDYTGQCNSSRCQVHGIEARAMASLLVELDATRLDLAAAIARAERAERMLASLPDCASRAETAELALGGLLARAERAEAGLAALHAQVSEIVRHRDAVPALEEAERRARADRGGAPDEGWGVDDAPPAWQAWRDARQRLDEAKRAMVSSAHALSIADAGQAAEAYRASVEAPLRAAIERLTAERDEGYRWGESHTCAAVVRAESAERERDTLAAALAEVREAASVLLARLAVFHAGVAADEARALNTALTALPADLAAERFRREREEALEEAADAFGADGQDLVWEATEQCAEHVSDWLRARAADERGGK